MGIAPSPALPRATPSHDFLDVSVFRSLAATGSVSPGALVACGLAAEITPGPSPRTKTFTLSTEDPDRMRDSVATAGWQLDNYRRTGGLVLWAHDYAHPPIGRSLSIGVRGNKLVSTAEFQPADLHPFADMIYRMVDGGWLKSVSVGFRPEEWSFNEARKGVDFKAQELLEYSVVPVPASPHAILEAKAAGVDLTLLREWAERILDERAFPPGLSIAEGETGQSVIARVVRDVRPAATISIPKATMTVPVVTTTGNAAITTTVTSASTALPVSDPPEPAEPEPEPPKPELVLKKIVRRGDKWCVTTEDGSKTLGCHDTQGEAQAQLAAVEASKARRGKGLAWLSRDQVKTLCPPCAEKMANLGMVRINLDGLADDSPLLVALRAGGGDGLFTKCMDEGWCKDAEDPKACCAAIHEKVTGRWPAEDKKETEPGVAVLHTAESIVSAAEVVLKRGRVLSSANEQELRAAVDTLAMAVEKIRTVLSKVEVVAVDTQQKQEALEAGTVSAGGALVAPPMADDVEKAPPTVPPKSTGDTCATHGEHCPHGGKGDDCKPMAMQSKKTKAEDPDEDIFTLEDDEEIVGLEDLDVNPVDIAAHVTAALQTVLAEHRRALEPWAPPGPRAEGSARK